MADRKKVKNVASDFIAEISSLRLDTSTLAIVIGIVVVLITLLIFYLSQRKKNLRRGVILMGLCECGKTLIFSQLVHKRFVETYTSIKENVGYYYPQAKGSLKIIDIPGHERLRMRVFDNFKTTARGIIFVVDSLTFQKELQDIAQFLYCLLRDPALANNCNRVLIVCNKQDHTLAKSWKVVKSQLEKEMNTVRVTESASLESTSSTGNNNTFLGKRGKDFEFAHLSPLQVEFADCSAKVSNKNDSADADLSAIESWLLKIA